MTGGRLPIFIDLHEARIGRPSEIVYVFGVVSVSNGAIRIAAPADFLSGRADDVSLWQSKLYVEYTEIRKELRGVVKLMAIPCSVPPYTYLGKPLSCHHEVVPVTSPSHNSRQFGFEADFECNISVRQNRLGQLHQKHRAIICIPVIRSDEFHLLGEITHAFDHKRLDYDYAKIFVIEIFRSSLAVAPRLSHPGGLGLKRIEIKMKW